MSAFIEENRGRFGVEPICRALEVSDSTYYPTDWRALGPRALGRALLVLIRKVHKENYEAYGYRRMWRELLRRGERAPRCEVQRVMAEHDIQGGEAARASVAHNHARP